MKPMLDLRADAGFNFFKGQQQRFLPGLLHLLITLFGLVLSGRRRCHNGGVNDGAFTHEQTLLGQTGIDFLEDGHTSPADGKSEVTWSHREYSQWQGRHR